MSAPGYDIIVGLEVHVQLATRTKLFSRSGTRFGAPTNTLTSPICIGLPGTLPVMNRRAFELAVKTGVALNCEIPPFTKWDRKQYYYPDLPKGYQISQYDLPLSRNGHLDVSDPQARFVRVRIRRAHLEEDAGKSMHDEADSRIDLNRAGTPLLEIVTEPDIRSPEQAKAFLTELKLLLTYLAVSDCNMQEGSLRVDANVNLHVHSGDGHIPTPIVEVKNMNSFRAVERALAYEAGRQFKEYQATGKKLGDVPKQTRGWDDTAEVTRGQRHKEESSDYRYFPDPDLVPVTVSEEDIRQIREEMDELPAALRSRLESTYGITPYDAGVIVSQGRELVSFFVRLADAVGDGKAASNWTQQDVLRYLNEQGIGVEAYPVQPDQLADLIRRVKAGEMDTTRGREVLAHMIESGDSVDPAMLALGIEIVDESELESLCREIVAANPHIAEDVRGGKVQAVGALIGQAKKKNPNVNPGRVREICLELIQAG